MGTDPRLDLAVGGGGEEGAGLRQVAEALSAMEEAASSGAPLGALERLVGFWASRLLGSSLAGVLRYDPQQNVLEGDQLFGCTERVLLRASWAPFADALQGHATWSRGPSALGFEFAVPLRGPGGDVLGVLASGPANLSGDPLLRLRALGSAVGPYLQARPSGPPPVLGAVLREAPAQALPVCVEGTARLFGAERACLYLARPDESLVVLHNFGLSERYIAAVLREHPRGPGGIAARLSGPLFIEDAFDDARTEVLRNEVRAEDIRSMLFIPSRWAGGLVGGLALYFTQKRHLTAVELEQATGIGLWMGPILRAVQQQQLIDDIPGGLLFQGSRGWVPLNARGAKALPSLAATPARQTQMSTSPPLLLEGPHHGAPLSLAVEAPRPASEDPARHQIAYLASHALRDPLTAIKGYLGLAVERLRRVGQQPIAQAVERILGPAERVAQVADALLSFAHLDAGQQVLARAPLDFVALLREVVAELSGEQAPIALQAGGSFLLRGDVERLRPALRCLLRCGAQVYEREGLRVIFSAGPEPTVQLGPAVPRAAGALLSLRNGLGLEGHLALYVLSLHGVKGDLPLHPGAPLCLSLPVSEAQAQ